MASMAFGAGLATSETAPALTTCTLHTSCMVAGRTVTRTSIDERELRPAVFAINTIAVVGLFVVALPRTTLQSAARKYKAFIFLTLYRV